MSLLEISVAADQSGTTVVALSGESDMTTAGQLSDFLTTQLNGGTRHMSVDLSGLRFADTASIRILLGAHRTLSACGGTFELVNPHPNVARSLTLLGLDRLFRGRNVPRAERADR